MSRLVSGAVPALAVALALAQPPAVAAAEPSAPVVETQRVTALDLLVELTRPKRPGRGVPAPTDLALEEFQVLWDGAALPLVGLATGPEDPEPWRLVVYFDRLLSSSHNIRWAAMELAERAARLTALGEVEIVVADPEPRRVLAANRDSELIDGTLSGVFLAPAGAAELVSRREEFLVRHPDRPQADAGYAEAARQAATEERLLVRRQADRLLEWLIDSEPPTSRRAVLLVGDGWDLDPGTFYAGGAADIPAGTAEPTLGAATDELAEVLAAHGWVVAPVAPPPPPVGAGRFGAFVLPDVTFPWLFAVKLRSLEVWLDGNRRPKEADALTELGHSLRAQGRLDEAVETYRKAIYHYYDHPKTALRQAAALVALGETLDERGEAVAARAAFRTATVFDAKLESRFPFAAAELLAPLAPLERIARVTTGSAIGDSQALDRLLTSLEHRVRLTTQLPGSPDGELHQLAVRLDRSGFEQRSPTVARWGTPPAVTELRLRRLLAGGLTAGQLEVSALSAGGPRNEDEGAEIVLRLPDTSALSDDGDPPAELLVSWASVGPASTIRYRVRTARVPLRRGDGSRAGTRTGARARVRIEPPPGHDLMALVVEDPVGGPWGGVSFELPAD